MLMQLPPYNVADCSTSTTDFPARPSAPARVLPPFPQPRTTTSASMSAMTTSYPVRSGKMRARLRRELDHTLLGDGAPDRLPRGDRVGPLLRGGDQAELGRGGAGADEEVVTQLRVGAVVTTGRDGDRDGARGPEQRQVHDLLGIRQRRAGREPAGGRLDLPVGAVDHQPVALPR